MLADNPPGATPSLIADARAGGSYAVNQTGTIGLDPAWAQAYAAGTATAVGLYSVNATWKIGPKTVMSLRWVPVR